MKYLSLLLALPSLLFAQPEVVIIGDDLYLSETVSAENQVTGLLSGEITKRGFTLVNLSEKGSKLSKVSRVVDYAEGKGQLNEAVVIILALGHNDVKTQENVKAIQRNLIKTIESIQAKQPQAEIILAGVRARNSEASEAYRKEFETVYFLVAADKKVALIQDQLQAIEGDLSLMTEKGELTEEGHLALAKNVWRVLRTKLSTAPKPAPKTVEPKVNAPEVTEPTDS